ncbi:uncharacterized protein B0H64DRAFT_197949 [Chaetomium fimeti]|uniref:Uncharacterized protein n=1 Tax=Chaetomium fimeti TaxID=1854472 RepID=A0AAE0HEN7_9PEZI|nr:hypothetical protein B0H64DRAFT_197949 [Chaetomium fimeti]
MPTYLCHGFRWQRRSVRVYVILHNLDDASPEWIIPAKSSQCILKSFYEVFEFLPYCSPKRGRYTPTRELDSGDGDDEDDGRVPSASSASTKARSQSRGRGRSQSQSTQQSRSQSRANYQQPLPPLPTTTDESSSASISAEDDFSAQSWSAIKLLEEYDPNDLTAVSRPYAYVADYAVRIDLSCSIIDEIAKYEQKQLQSAHPAVSIPSGDTPPQSQGWFEGLRDELQHGEEIRWYVVVNNDEVRDWADEGSESTSSSGPPERGYQHQPDQTYQPSHQQQQQQQQPSQHQSQYQSQQQPPPGRPIPSREQRQHHAQYIHQQHIFEGSDQEKDQVPEKAQKIGSNGQEQKRGGQQQQLVFGESDQQRKHDEEKRQQQLLLQKREQQRKQEEEKRQQQLNLEQSQRQREREQEEEEQRLAWRELELKKARQRERERQRQREREKELERERERALERERKREGEERRQRDQIPPPHTNGTDINGQPPMVPEKDFFFPRPPTAKPNANTQTNAPPLRPKISIDFGRPKTPGGKGGGLRRLFSRAKIQVDGGVSP